jgi:hypothetical protein
MTAPSNLLFVGETNPYGQDPRFALYHYPRHASGNKLREHLGLTDEVYEAIPKMNLCTGKWSAKVGRERADAIKGQVSTDLEVVVLLGANVRDAFGFFSQEFFQVKKLPGVIPKFVLLPHPSGLSRPWNWPRADQTARELMRSVYPQLQWGKNEQ